MLMRFVSGGMRTFGRRLGVILARRHRHDAPVQLIAIRITELLDAPGRSRLFKVTVI